MRWAKLLMLLPYMMFLLPSSSLMRVLLGSLMVTSVVLGDSSNNGAVQLKVSIKEDALRHAPSCIQTMSQVELVNTHNYDTITIKSMETISTQAHEPEQLHVPQFHNRVLTLKPGQAAMVPICFFPQYPVSQNNRLDNFRASIPGRRSSSERLSAAAAAELDDLMSLDTGSHTHLNEEENSVHAMLHLRTSRGNIETPIKATSIRKNAYGLTDSIVFRDDPSGGTIPDVSNIYIDNPSSTDELRIVEVFASNPDSVKVEHLVQQQHVQSTDHSSDNNYARKNHHPSIDRPIAIPPGGKGFYVGSVSLIPGKNDSYDTSSTTVQDLGFVHIRTSSDHLIVSVDRLVGGSNKASIPAASNESIESEMTVSPSIVDFGMLNVPIEQTAKVGINVTNHSPRPLRLMRVTIGIDVSDGHSVDSSHLNFSVEMGNSESLRGHDVIIPPNGGVATNAIVISCSSSPQDPSVYASNMPMHYKGTILVRAGDASEDFEEWRQNVQKDPMAAQNMVIEIPYSVKVLHGSIDFELDQLYFPYWKHLGNEHELVLTEEDGAGKKRKRPSANFSMKRTLYFINKFPIPLSFHSIRIGNSTVASGSDDVFCQRFGISSFEGTNGSLTTARSGKRWGGVTLQFIYGTDDKDGFIKPKVCPLILETDKAGEFVIPLIVYSGQLSIEMNRAGRTSVPVPCSSSEGTSWMGCANTWYSNSTDGSALRAALAQRLLAVGDVKGVRRVEVLSSYLQYIFFGASGGNPLPRQIHPLLLFLGAIGAGEVETYSLFLSNMNPAPVTVWATSPAVEGMEISLGRSPRTILDFLQPSQNDGKDGVRHFLATSPLGQHFFGKLGCSADVNLSPQAASSELNVLFRKNSLVSTFRESVDEVDTDRGDTNETTLIHPLGFSGGRLLNKNTVDASSKDIRGTGAGLLLSTDGSLVHDLRPIKPSCSKTRQGFVLPPGSVARLSLSVHAPSKAALKQDVTSFVGTGLMLETNHGEKMPIFLTYDALLGQFQLSATGAQPRSEQKMKEGKDEKMNSLDNKAQGETKLNDEHKEITRIYVPATIRRPKTEERTTYQRQNRSNGTQKEEIEQRFLSRDPNGVELFMESTFSQDMVLRNVESCNSWFSVLLTPSMMQKAKSLPPEQGSERVSSYRNNNATFISQDCDRNHDGSNCNTVHSSSDRGTKTVDQSHRGANDSITIRAKILSGTTTSAPSKVAIGTAHSVIACSGRSKQYSFFSCALEWLEKRDSIQPPGCGLSEEEIIADLSQNKGGGHGSKIVGDMLHKGSPVPSRGSQGESTRQVVKNSAILAFREVVSYLSTRYDDQDALFFTQQGHNRNSSHSTTNAASRGNNDEEVYDYFHANLSETDPISHSHEQSLYRNAEYATPELLSYATVQKFEAANEAWKKVCAMGLNIITGTVRAKTDYLLYESDKERTDFEQDRLVHGESVQNESNKPHRQSSLTVSMPSLILQSTLDLPKLFDDTEARSNANEMESNSVLDFDPTHVAQVSKRYMRVRNPSGVPIRVRLSAPSFADDNEEESHNPIFVQSNSGDSHPWWTGGSYWVADSESNLLQSNHNLTIKSGGGAYVSLINPSLHSISSFILGCGKRCGLRNEVSNTAEKMYSPIGAASAEHSVLLGHSQESHGVDELGQSSHGNLKTSTPPAFALGLRSQSEIILPPHGTGLLGPIYFRPPKRGNFEGKVYIENSLSGLETVTFRGNGAWEKVVFLDDENHGEEGTGGDVEVRYGRPTLMFSGSASSTSGNGVVKSVIVANVGDVPANFDSIYVTTGENRFFKGSRPVPRHSEDSHNQEKHRVYVRRTSCSERGYRLLGCIDNDEDEEEFVSGIGDSLIGILFGNGWRSSWLSKVISTPKVLLRAEYNENKSGLGDSNLKRGFSLQPNETKTLYIEHTPDCTFRSMYASLILEYRDRTDFRGRRSGGSHGVNGWERSFQSQRVELLLGYDMGQDDAHVCVPLAPSFMSKIFRWITMSKCFRDGDESNLVHHHDSIPPERDLAIFISIILFLIMAWTSANVMYNMMRRNTASALFLSTLSPIDSGRTNTRTASNILRIIWKIVDSIKGEGARSTAGNNNCFTWNATFRCLARADPNSTDLVALGKEQTRQVLFGKYKKLNINLPTQCLLANGSFARDMIGANKSGNDNGSSTAGGEAEVRSTGGHLNRRNSTGSQQILTLSDAMFNQLDIHSEGANQFLPCGLGWRVAASQGIIAPYEIGIAPCPVQGGRNYVKELSLKRKFLKKQSQESQECNLKSQALSSTSSTVGLSRANLGKSAVSTQIHDVADSFDEGNMISKESNNNVESSDSDYPPKPAKTSDVVTQSLGASATTSSGDLMGQKSSLFSDKKPVKSSSDAPLAKLPASSNGGGSKAKEELPASNDDGEDASSRVIKQSSNESNTYAPASSRTRNTTKTTNETLLVNKDVKKTKKKNNGEKQQSKKHLSRINDPTDDGTSSQKSGKVSRSEKSPGAPIATTDHTRKTTKGKFTSKGKAQSQNGGNVSREGDASDVRGRWRKDDLQKTSQSSDFVPATNARNKFPTKRSKKQQKKKLADESVADEPEVPKKPSRQRGKQRPENQSAPGRRPITSSPQSSMSSVTTQSTSESGTAQSSLPGSPVSVFNNTSHSRSRKKLDVTTKDNLLPSLSPEPPSLPNGKADRYATHGLQRHQLGSGSSSGSGLGSGTLRPPPGLAPPPGFSADRSNTNSWGNFGGGDSSNVPNALSPETQTTPGAAIVSDNDGQEINSVLSYEHVLSSPLAPMQSSYSSFERSSSPMNELQGAGLLASILSERSSNLQSADGSDTSGVNVIAGTELRTISSAAPGGNSFLEKSHRNVAVGSTAEDFLVPSSGFDVTHFLDSILNDSVNVEEEGNGAESNGNAGVGSAPKAISQSALYQGSSTTISSDPWSHSGIASNTSSYNPTVGGSTRARPLGVSTLREDSIDESTENATMGNIPLLTPAIILNDEENNEKVDEYFGAESSFYADLLGE